MPNFLHKIRMPGTFLSSQKEKIFFKDKVLVLNYQRVRKGTRPLA